MRSSNPHLPFPRCGFQSFSRSTRIVLPFIGSGINIRRLPIDDVTDQEGGLVRIYLLPLLYNKVTSSFLSNQEPGSHHYSALIGSTLHFFSYQPLDAKYGVFMGEVSENRRLAILWRKWHVGPRAFASAECSNRLTMKWWASIGNKRSRGFTWLKCTAMTGTE